MADERSSGMQQPVTTVPWYQRGYRRMLLDMHLADWDAGFLAAYDPAQLAARYARAGVSSVMLYVQSHVGLCYYPTQVGKMHASLRGRDVVGELVAQLHRQGTACCAYYSVIYNNWAYLEHPDWRIVPTGDSTDGSFAGHRYGHCCPNHPDYRAFVLAQTTEILTGYAFDGFFYDMTFWPALCQCPHCRARFRAETGEEFPTRIDWCDPHWCALQTARERWMDEFAGLLSGHVKALRPAVSVYHNFATVLFNWTLGLSAATAVHHDFLGADFYGDALEQLVVSKLMGNLTPHRPLEFMTSYCVNLRDHGRVKSREALEMQAFAATFFGAPFLCIDAINLDGTVNPSTFARVGDIFAQTAPYESYLGGEEIADIAVYFSSDAKMDFTENGLPLDQAPLWRNDYPHLRAVRGACRILQQAHLPFTIITRKQLAELARYPVLVLPNVLRMDAEEVAAIRAYVAQGGRLYASRYTALTDTDGTRHADFALADVFGCHLLTDDLGGITYLRPVDNAVRAAIAPQEYLSVFQQHRADGSAGMLRLTTRVEGEVLATLTLPYAEPHTGTVDDQQWASIHASPPWTDSDHPVLVRHAYGQGRAIYAAADLETTEQEANHRLLLALLTDLLPAPPRYQATVHPAVWMNVYQQAERQAMLIVFLNYQQQLPAIPLPPFTFTLRPPDGTRFTALLRLPEETPLPFTIEEDGVLRAECPALDVFHMLRANYQ